MNGNVFFKENPNDSQKYLPNNYNPLGERRLHVEWVAEGKHPCTIGVLSYTIYTADEDHPEFGLMGRVPDLNVQEVLEYVSTNLEPFFREVVPEGNPEASRWESFYTSLIDIGETLFERIVPGDVANYLRQWNSGWSITLSTNENWIPWEFLHDGSGFWGEKFIISRRPRIPAGRRRATEQKITCDSPEIGQVQTILNIVGGNLDRQTSRVRVNQTQATETFSNLSLSLSINNRGPCPVTDLTSSMIEADIIHFTCHGLEDPLRLQVDAESNHSTNLRLERIRRINLRNGCFVFANACNSATILRLFDENTSFGYEFYERGANVFIGTLGPVPIQYAIEFAKDIYQVLFTLNNNENNPTIGYAIALAKRRASDRNNLFWLLYCLYGNSNFHVKNLSN